MFDEGAHTVRHAVVTAGDNASKAHPYPSPSKILTAGDIIRIDVGGLFGGFGSDIARMAIVGEARDDQQALYDKVRGCVHHVGPRMKAGMSAADVYQAAVDYYAGVDLPGYKRDHVGHSLSILGGHDNPMLHSRDATILEDGMVIAFEPILRDREGRRYTVEDTFVVGKGGAEHLTTLTDTRAMAVIA
jgi:Xaa-Pro aminopeptidase